MSKLKEIRLLFEPKSKVPVMDSAMGFKSFISKHLNGFDLNHDGHISMDVKESVETSLQPVWQVFKRNTTTYELRDIRDFLQAYPVPGYFTHIYTRSGNKNYEKDAIFPDPV